VGQADIESVRRYWDDKPLLSMELSAPLGSKAYLDAFDAIRLDLEQFCIGLWEFDRHKGEKVLDVGCGAPAFLVRQYAKGGADVTGVDISPRSVEAAQQHVAISGLSAKVEVGNAEALSFPDATFDFVTSAGVLHHTPDTEKAVSEVYRVLKPGGRAVIALYWRNVLMRWPLWWVTRLALKLLLKRVPGRDRMVETGDVNEFVRMWDGDENPVGKAYDRRGLRKLFSQFRIEKIEPHIFHRRFLRVELGPRLHRLADRYGATLAYAVLSKDR
jgi:ubiquinone/menaquinone biosynthesis C-methylase UbiE